MNTVARPLPKSTLILRSLATIGPGLLVMLADCDVGNVATSAQAGAHWGFRLLPLLLLLTPVLYLIQELTVRLGIFAGRGLGELVRERCTPTWRLMMGVGLVTVVLTSLVTEFTGVAGIGELYGVSRFLSVPLAAAALLAIVATGSYRRIERVTLWIGLFQFAFIIVAATAHPGAQRVVHEIRDLPLGNRAFWFMAAALIGACFNPWMLFYQQSAIVDKRLGPYDYKASRAETAVGAVITQLLTASVLFAAATTFGPLGFDGSLETVGDVSESMKPLLGNSLGPLVFSVGVLGASMVAAVVCSLAMAWGIGELCGMRRALEQQPGRLRWFLAIYAAGAVSAGLVVLYSPDLLWLNILAQVTNVFMLPLVAGTVIVLAATCLPVRYRLRGRRLWLTACLAALTCGAGVVCAVGGFTAHSDPPASVASRVEPS
jgi:NRAMP (natural resistance-associated macrophage protein)-like metal ion transporter